MTRRTRRRLQVLLLAAALGGSAPVWAPPVLSRFSFFRVEEVGVVGTRYVAPAEVVERASVDSGASVWDDTGRWERRVAGHPLIRGARIRRAGLHRLEIHVREVEPVALVATPELVPVDRRGKVLPLDPVENRLDLPILGREARVEDGRVTSEDVLTLLGVLVRLRREEPGFVRQASQLTLLRGGDVRIYLSGSDPCEEILLPTTDPVESLRRVEMALSQHASEPAVRTADARFDGQVVLRLKGEA